MSDIVPLLRTSERRSFAHCQQQWQWAWREGLVPRGQASDPLWFGTGIHIALAVWYCGPGLKRGVHPAETWEKYADGSIAAMRVDVPGWDDERDAKWVDLKTLGLVLMEEYVKHYGRDEYKLIIKPEMTFSLDIPWPSNQRLYEPTPLGLLCRYHGTTDATWRHADTGEVWLDEHKTEKSPRRGHLVLDNQAGSYWAIVPRYLREWGLLGPKDKMAGIEYNFIRKALPDDRPRDNEGYACNQPKRDDYVRALASRSIPPPKWGWDSGRTKVADLSALAEEHGIVVLGARSKIQPVPLFDRVQVHRTGAERVTQLVRIQQEALHMTAVRDGILPVNKTPSPECGWCPFVEMCELHEQNGNWEDYKKAVFFVRDPYADHR